MIEIKGMNQMIKLKNKTKFRVFLSKHSEKTFVVLL